MDTFLITVEIAGHTYELCVTDGIFRRIVGHRCEGRWGWGNAPIGDKWLEKELEKVADAKFDH